MRDMSGEDHDPASFSIYLDSTALGGLDACQALGSMYAHGGSADAHAFPIDLQKSFAYHKRACDGGLAEGCMTLAYMYEKGEHVAVDVATAAQLYQRACYVGAGDACYGLAQLYAEGRGVKKDDAQAKGFLEQGCRNGGARACFALAQRLYDGQSNVRGACCTVGYLLRACDGKLRSACESAKIMCDDAEDPRAMWTEACPRDKLDGCEMLIEK
jgi:TPR repeat protein